MKSELSADRDNMRLMQIVLRETDRLGSLVNNFLTFARPSAGRTQAVDLTQALAEIITLFEKDSSVGQRIKIDFNALAEAPRIDIDPLQLHQVIWNLLLNSAEAIVQQGHISVTVQKMKNERILVEVADNGCGMDETTLDTIFNPFYTTKPNGTGLGLSIVYRILETYDCHVDVQSKPGVGSRFCLYFKPSQPPQ
ncbi:sensor histidine kinase [Desulfosarcina cetonica]|uniref:sensor histidine kinase n=1 Tax=Desulfosarcina cetonica TaxID=90730 RepID=UPI0006D2C205|nr:ATP-binding protein [Desulfosarcina cetonica]